MTWQNTFAHLKSSSKFSFCLVESKPWNSNRHKRYSSNRALKTIQSTYVQLDSQFTDLTVKLLILLISKPPDFKQQISQKGSPG